MLLIDTDIYMLSLYTYTMDLGSSAVNLGTSVREDQSDLWTN